MKAKCGILIVILSVLAAAGALHAQQTPEPAPASRRSSPESATSAPPVFYRLDLVIRELDGEKPVDTRRYSMWVQSGTAETTTAGSEIPYTSASYSSKEGTGTTKSIGYRSVGVSITCLVKESGAGPHLDLKLNISEALPPPQDLTASVYRKISLESKALLTPGKPTSVGIVEDPANRHRLQVEVTATKLN